MTLAALPQVTLLPLDLTDERSVQELAAEIGGKVDILVNNAEHHRAHGIASRSGTDVAQAEMEINYFGLLRLAQAFGPAMRARGADGQSSATAWVNLLSVFALSNFPAHGTFSASKAAAHSLVAVPARGDAHGRGSRHQCLPRTDRRRVEPDAAAAEARAGGARACRRRALRDGVEDVYPGDVAQEWRERWRESPKVLERELALGLGSMSVTLRRAIVTGGSAGIGAEVCRQLLTAGYEVISLARRTGDIRDPRFSSIEVDLSNADATRRIAFELARERPATTLVHNAGAVRERPLEQVTPEDLDALVGLHLAAPIALLQANLAAMRQEHYGRVVLVSTRAVLGLAKRTVYSATKAGLLGLARTWALELGAQGITVNVVAPGPIGETEVFENLIPKDSPQAAPDHPVDPRRASGPAAGRGARGALLHVAGRGLRHRPDAVRLRRHLRRQHRLLIRGREGTTT